MMPRSVILDPAATVHTPEWLFLSTGIRAVDHAVEDICSINPQPLSDGTSLHALRLLSRGLRAVKADPGNLEARLDCQLGSWMSIMGSQNGVTKGASHGIGHVLGGTAGVPHGYTSCVMLPPVLRFNAGRQRRAPGLGERGAGPAGRSSRRRGGRSGRGSRPAGPAARCRGEARTARSRSPRNRCTTAGCIPTRARSVARPMCARCSTRPGDAATQSAASSRNRLMSSSRRNGLRRIETFGFSWNFATPSARRR